MTGILISVNDLSVTLGGRRVVHDISFDVSSGEVVSLIGPNGAGKTSIVRALLGVVPATGDIDKKPGLTIGYVPQRLHVEPTLPLTVARLLCLTRQYDEGTMAAAMAEVGAPGLLSRQVHDLSGGEFQRVLLARALLGKPDLLILDEPTQGVDFTGQSELYRLIGRIRETRGCGVLLISHDLHVVMAQTDKVICINHHICCQGKPESVAADPAYAALFGARERDALAVFRHHHTHAHDAAGDVLENKTGPEFGPGSKTGSGADHA